MDAVISPNVAQQVTLAVISAYNHCLLVDGPGVVGLDHRRRVAHGETVLDKRADETVTARILVMVVDAVSACHDTEQASVIGAQHAVPCHTAASPVHTVDRGVERTVLGKDKQCLVGSGERCDLRDKGQIDDLPVPCALIGAGSGQQFALLTVIHHDAVQFVSLLHRFVSDGVGLIAGQVTPPLLGPYQQVGIHLVDEHLDFVVLHLALVLAGHGKHRLAGEVELLAHRRRVLDRGVGLAGGTRDIEHSR